MGIIPQLITLYTGLKYGEYYKEDTLASIIYPTEKSLFHYKNFIRSFIIYNKDLSFNTIPEHVPNVVET